VCDSEKNPENSEGCPTYNGAIFHAIELGKCEKSMSKKALLALSRAWRVLLCMSLRRQSDCGSETNENAMEKIKSKALLAAH
jgi:hypothetical protein